MNNTTFISYAWESNEIKTWVNKLATELRNNGIDAKLDQWEVVPGDQIPLFMERSVRENSFVLIICTPKYKIKSENRIGGVGYEGDIMTAEVMLNSNHRKFIPILCTGDIYTSIPSWLQGKYYVDLSNDSHYKNNFEDLITTLLNSRQSAPPLGKIKEKYSEMQTLPPLEIKEEIDIRIKGILIDEITQPRMDGTAGSSLYKIPFELNKTPNYDWVQIFIGAWNRPSSFTTMHRPGIATVIGKKIILDGTTIDEVEKYHKDTLKLAVQTANQVINELQERIKQQKEMERIRQEQHKRNVNEIGKRINFD